MDRCFGNKPSSACSRSHAIRNYNYSAWHAPNITINFTLQWWQQSSIQGAYAINHFPMVWYSIRKTTWKWIHFFNYLVAFREHACFNASWLRRWLAVMARQDDELMNGSSFTKTKNEFINLQSTNMRHCSTVMNSIMKRNELVNENQLLFT